MNTTSNNVRNEEHARLNSLQEQLTELKQQCTQSEIHSRNERRRFRVQMGLALATVAGAILLSPTNRAAIAQTTGLTLAALDARLTAVENKTQYQSVDANGNTCFTATNLYVLNGSGNTAGAVNGKGNLIVGYNELRGNGFDVRTGSHNLIVGAGNSYASYGGVVFGCCNLISGQYASVCGGDFNVASGYSSSVSGGDTNVASNISSSVSGGLYNVASGYASMVSGGCNNTASNDFASVGGGDSNLAGGSCSSVGGGRANVASGDCSSISGGQSNTASSAYSSVSGGVLNMANASYSSVSGGYSNMAHGYASAVSGGYKRSNSGNYNWMAGGLYQLQ